MVILAYFRGTFFAMSRKVLGFSAFLKKQNLQCKILYPIGPSCILDLGPPMALNTCAYTYTYCKNFNPCSIRIFRPSRNFLPSSNFAAAFASFPFLKQKWYKIMFTRSYKIMVTKMIQDHRLWPLKDEWIMNDETFSLIIRHRSRWMWRSALLAKGVHLKLKNRNKLAFRQKLLRLFATAPMLNDNYVEQR